VRVLSLDGGGLRGILQALYLSRLEQLAGKPVRDLFDYVVGTSTGGLLALALTSPKAPPAAELVRFYLDDGPKIFPRRRLWNKARELFGPRYSPDELRNALTAVLGEAKLADAAVPVSVCAYDIEENRPKILRSTKARSEPGYRQWTLVEAGLATTAAPTYFPPAGTLVDGGVWANNPALVAYVDVRSRQSNSINLLSLGSGSNFRTFDPNKASSWGLAGWAPPILEILQSGNAAAVHTHTATLMQRETYRRWEPQLGKKIAMDDASQLTWLHTFARVAVDAEEETIASLAATLTQPRSVSGWAFWPSAQESVIR
jgi:uncharacterized protein